MTDAKEAETITLSPEALRAAEEIQMLAGLKSVEDAVSLALGDELYFRRKIRDDYRVLVKKDDDYREVDLSINFGCRPQPGHVVRSL